MILLSFVVIHAIFFYRHIRTRIKAFFPSFIFFMCKIILKFCIKTGFRLPWPDINLKLNPIKYVWDIIKGFKISEKSLVLWLNYRKSFGILKYVKHALRSGILSPLVAVQLLSMLVERCLEISLSSHKE